MDILRQTARIGLVQPGLIISSGENASCYCTCTNEDNVPICSGTYEVPPIFPPTVCQIAQPSVAPVQSPYVPPVGTQNCQQQQVQNRTLINMSGGRFADNKEAWNKNRDIDNTWLFAVAAPIAIGEHV